MRTTPRLPRSGGTEPPTRRTQSSRSRCSVFPRGRRRETAPPRETSPVRRARERARRAVRRASRAELRIPTVMSVPTIPLATPPPGSPTGAGRWVRNSKFHRRKALHGHVAEDEQEQDGADRRAGRRHHRAGVTERVAQAQIAGLDPLVGEARHSIHLRSRKTVQSSSRAKPLTTKLTTNNTKPSSISALI